MELVRFVGTELLISLQFIIFRMNKPLSFEFGVPRESVHLRATCSFEPVQAEKSNSSVPLV